MKLKTKHINLVFLAVILVVNIGFRILPGWLPFTKDMAVGKVNQELFLDAYNKVSNSSDSLVSLDEKNILVQKILDDKKKNEKNKIKDLVVNKQKEFKSYWQDDRGQTYLLEIDPYHWFRLTRNLVQTGKIETSSKNKIYYDDYMLAPKGFQARVSMHKNFHVYLSAYIYKFIRLLVPGVSLISVVFYLPVLITAFLLVILFYLCSSISKNHLNIAGFFASITLWLSPILLSRSMAGWFDTDPYVILFSLLTVWLFYLSINPGFSLKRKILFAFLTGISIALFSFTWDGWWYIFDILIFSGLYYLLNLYMNNKTDKRIEVLEPVKSFLIFILFSSVLVCLISGWGVFKNFFVGLINLFYTKNLTINNFWPNTFLTVQELRKMPFVSIINGTGGMLLLFVSLWYLFLTIFKKSSDADLHRQFAVMLFVVWIFVFLLVSQSAARFEIMLVMPISISFGLGLEKIYYFLSGLKIKRFNEINKKIVLMIILFMTMVFLFWGNAYIYSSRVVPMMHRDFESFLIKIKASTPQGSIINSWWDFGHLFKAIADRPVIFDGATQNTPIAYWMGRAMLARDEQESYGILRMLNSGSNMAFEDLCSLGFDKRKSLEILSDIILLDKDSARKFLTKYLTKTDQIDKIILSTHNPKKAYFLFDPTLASKLNAISFLGNWNFKKAEIYEEFKKDKTIDFIRILQSKYGYSFKDASGLHKELLSFNPDKASLWISKVFSTYAEQAQIRRESNKIFFSNGCWADLDKKNVYCYDGKSRSWKYPKSLIYLEDGTIKEKKFLENTVDFSVVLVKNDGKDKYLLVYLDELAADSVFTKLYFFNGEGLKYYKIFIKEKLKDNDWLFYKLYSIDWK